MHMFVQRAVFICHRKEKPVYCGCISDATGSLLPSSEMDSFLTFHVAPGPPSLKHQFFKLGSSLYH